MPSYALTDLSVATFIAIPVALSAALAWGAHVAWRRTGAPAHTARRVALLVWLAALSWMAMTWLVAGTGILTEWQRTPPPFALLILSVVVLACGLAFSPFGRRLATSLPLWSLVAVQAFRLPLELAMHQMYERGIMPVQMSYSGRNFDILSGLTALVVAILVWTGRGGTRLVAVWNVLGLTLLVNVVTIAVVSTPPIAYFGPERLNVWVTLAPFVWLPAVMVLAALAGHLLICRALWARR